MEQYDSKHPIEEHFVGLDVSLKSVSICVMDASPAAPLSPSPATSRTFLASKRSGTVGNDNTLRYKNMVLQIPENRHRHHYVKAKVQVHHYPDGTLAVFHGPRQLAAFDENGKPMEDIDKLAA